MNVAFIVLLISSFLYLHTNTLCSDTNSSQKSESVIKKMLQEATHNPDEVECICFLQLLEARSLIKFPHIPRASNFKWWKYRPDKKFMN